MHGWGRKTSDKTDSLALAESHGIGKVDTMEIRTKRLITIISDNIYNYSNNS